MIASVCISGLIDSKKLLTRLGVGRAASCTRQGLFGHGSTPPGSKCFMVVCISMQVLHGLLVFSLHGVLVFSLHAVDALLVALCL
jgi:hypothetical protein